MIDVDRRVDLQLRRATGEAVLVGRPRNVVPGGEVLEMDPGQPGRRVAAGRRTAFLDLLGVVPHLIPGLGRRVLVQPGLLEDILVVIKDRRGRVVGEGQHGAVGLGVVGDDAGQVLALVELEARVGQHVRDRLDRAFGRHHHAGADVEDLDDVRRLAGAEGGNAGVQRLGIGALEDGNDLVVLLAGVEVLGNLVDHLGIGAGHGVPPGDLGHGKGRGGGKQGQGGGETGRKAAKLHVSLPICRWRGEPAAGVSTDYDRCTTVLL